MAQVAPSILAADFARLGEECARVVSTAHPYLHFDVMDGNFVPNLSVGLPVLESLHKALPKAMYDVHLMIERPHRYVEQFAKAGADNITVHVEAGSPVGETLDAIHAAGCTAGVTLRPGTALQDIFPFLEKADMALVMSVEPGFGGQSFIPEALKRIAALRAEANRLGTKLLIEVDGGINEETGPACIAAGADLLVAGNAVFRAGDPVQAMNRILGK